MKKAKFIGAAMALALTFSTGAGLIPQISNSIVMTADAATPGYYKVNGNGVRHRKTPSNNGTILGLMYKGEGVTTDGTQRGVWVKVYRQKTRQTGWVHKNYITLYYH